MRIIDVPASLRASASLLFLAIPLAGIQLMLAQRVQWWRIPYAQVAIAAGAAAAVVLPVAWGIARGSRVAWRIGSVLATFWCLAGAWLAIEREYTALAYFAIFLAGYLIAAFRWSAFELSRSYLDPRQSWFQGRPREIPGLRCHAIGPDERQADFRVCRMDLEGAYLFSPGSASADTRAELERWKRAELVFKHRDSEVRCKARARGSLAVGAGLGFEFVGVSPDERKELGDFVESLRGVGYVE